MVARAVSTRPVLWHLPTSHYSEKPRWALEYKGIEHDRRAPAFGYHMAVALWLTRGAQYTFPVLELDGDRIGGSSAIIAALERRFPEPSLYPPDPDGRQRALALEDWFDRELGPDIRQFAFHEFRGDRGRFGTVVRDAAPPLMARFRRMSVAYARAFTAVRYGASSDRAAERARDRVRLALDRLEGELAGNEYLVGERFSVADLTAASLFYPLVLPPEGPARYEPPDGLAGFRDSLSGRPGFKWVERMFREHRRPPAAPASSYRQQPADPLPL